MAAKDPKSPATTSDAYDRMLGRWVMIDTLMGGTEAMRAAGERYLPKHTEETDLGYRERLQANVLLNMTAQTLDQLSGKPFSAPIKVNDDVPPAIREQVLDDVDLQGNKLDVFTRQWFREGLAKALCHVLVDMPRPQPKPDGKPRTLADDRKEGLRPYWVLIKPECLLFARADIIGGVEVLQHVRILESYTVQNGFAEITKKRIRVLEPGRVELWEPKPRKNTSQKEEWIRVDDWETGLSYIPLVTFYADRQCFMEGKPPLEDLAQLNVTHWQSTADQRHILTVARFPQLACSGATKEDSDPIVIGPNKVLYNPDPQGKFYYVEHTGAAIEQGWKDLEQLERQMAGYGAEFLKEKPGNETATARALDSAEATTDLASMAGIFEDAVAQALSITAEWMKLGSEGGTIEVIKQYDAAELDAEGVTALADARRTRDISRQTYLQGLVLRGILPEDFDPEEDAELLQDETDALMALGGTLDDLDPAGKHLPGMEGEDKDEGTGEDKPGTKKPKPKAKKPAKKKSPTKEK